MDFKPILIENKKLFDQYLAGRYYELIPYNFTTLFTFRHSEKYTWQELEGALCIKGIFKGKEVMICPISPKDENIITATKIMIEDFAVRNVPFLMTEVPESLCKLLINHMPGIFTVEEYRDGHNYIYNREDLEKLSGNRYSGKRNHIHRFHREYPNNQFLPLTEDLFSGCKELLDNWYARHVANYGENFDILADNYASREALDNYAALDCMGACLLVNDRVEAFTIGERFNSDTALIHVEKANIDILGAYQVINNYFVRDYCGDFTYINREDDMGEPGLRKAKLSYHPCRLEKRFHLRLK
jgi:hypothetical protein